MKVKKIEMNVEVVYRLAVVVVVVVAAAVVPFPLCFSFVLL
jgi:hypothetical protein